jgi:hypothetical protein
MPSYLANFWIAFEVEADDEEDAARQAEELLREVIESGDLADHVNEVPDIYPN